MTCTFVLWYFYFWCLIYVWQFYIHGDHTISSCALSDLFFCSKLSVMSLCSLTIFILNKTLTYHNDEFIKKSLYIINLICTNTVTAHKKVNKTNLILFCSSVDHKDWKSYSPFLCENGIVFDFLLKLPVQLHLLSFQSIARRFKLPNDLQKKIEIDVDVQTSA